MQSSLASAGRGRNYGHKVVEQSGSEVNSKTETKEVIDNFITQSEELEKVIKNNLACQTSEEVTVQGRSIAFS